MTNYEKIKNMSIEELAYVLMCPVEAGLIDMWPCPSSPDKGDCFGRSGHLFAGGWVEIHAHTIIDATHKYIARYKEKAHGIEGRLTYEAIYTQEDFSASEMPKDGHEGRHCHEVIE